MELSRQEYWSGLLFPSPGDLPNSGIEPGSPALQADALPSKPRGQQGKAIKTTVWHHTTPVRMVMIHKRREDKCWCECGEKGILVHYWWNYPKSMTRVNFWVAQMVKNPPAMQETQVRSPGWEDPLEKWLATHSSISLIAQLEKNMPAMQETWVWFLSWEDPLEKEMAIHSSILAQKIPWTEEPRRLQSTELQRVRYDWACTHRKDNRIIKF